MARWGWAQTSPAERQVNAAKPPFKRKDRRPGYDPEETSAALISLPQSGRPDTKQAGTSCAASTQFPDWALPQSLLSRPCEIHPAAAMSIPAGAVLVTPCGRSLDREALGLSSNAINMLSPHRSTDRAQMSPPRPRRLIARISQRML